MNSILTTDHDIDARVYNNVSQLIERISQLIQDPTNYTVLSIDKELITKVDTLDNLPTERTVLGIVTYLDYKSIKLLSICDGVIFIGQTLERLAKLFFVEGGFETLQLSKHSPLIKDSCNGNQLLMKNSKMALYHNFESTDEELGSMDISQVTLSFIQRCKSRKSKFISAYHKDEYHLVAGAPVNSQFVFSVCFRNQDKKLIRCVDSISKLASTHDIGIVLVDDNSENHTSLREAISLLEKRNVKFYAVISPIRYGASRNLYNVIHHLSIGDNGWFIEVDGDDFILPETFGQMLHSVKRNNVDKVFGGLCVHKGGAIDHDKKFAREKTLNNYNRYLNMSKLSAWLAPRLTKKSIMKKVHINNYLEIDGRHWLKCIHDSCVHAHAFKLSDLNKILEIPYSVYVYDVDGEDHDTNEYTGEDIDAEWDYGSYTINNPYLFNTWTPLMEEPKEIKKT